VEISSQVNFADQKLRDAFQALDSDKYQEKQLHGWLERAFTDIENNAFCATQIPKKLIPKYYQKKYGPIDNLWKYDLPSAWRVIYTVKRDQVVVLSIVLEWMTHKEYEKRFGYTKK
jgi:Txe/YoeB family toxin of Txe-Axe toxin-antitoxin module